MALALQPPAALRRAAPDCPEAAAPSRVQSSSGSGPACLYAGRSRSAGTQPRRIPRWRRTDALQLIDVRRASTCAVRSGPVFVYRSGACLGPATLRPKRDSRAAPEAGRQVSRRGRHATASARGIAAFFSILHINQKHISKISSPRH